MSSDDYGRVERAIRYLETHFRERPGLVDIARATGLSEFHFQRLFSRWAGISPKRFLQFLTADYARGLLRESPSVLDAAYEAGLSGPGRLHDLIVTVHAATPGEMKAQGAGLTIRYGIHPSPFGDCFIAITGKGICTLSFLAGRGIGKAIGQLRNEWQKAKLIEDAKATGDTMKRIFDSSLQRNTIPLHAFVKGTNFQIKVWEALVRIPPGFAVSYEDVAARIGDPKAVRAVGTAVGRNPVAFLIPCHRVIRKTGAFGNYRGGPARKMAILAWEGAKFR
jgi:AraC family transcriptional regulator, regulatory protein of adaptative response / methylated-DNA-[protein]-cysteine methyltransferase